MKIRLLYVFLHGAMNQLYDVVVRVSAFISHALLNYWPSVHAVDLQLAISELFR